MIDLTPEKRAELRREATAAHHSEFPKWLPRATVLSLLDALDAKDAEIAELRARDPNDPVNTPGTLSWTREAMRIAGHTCGTDKTQQCEACEDSR